MGILLAALAGCGRKLTQEDCNHLLGRGVGLAAYSGGAEAPVDLDYLRGRAHGAARGAIAEFDRACPGGDEAGQVACARRANDRRELEQCGGTVTKALTAGDVVKLVIPKRHSADECARYADHGVKIGAAPVDDAGKLVRECDDWMEEGMFLCRLAAVDARAWGACATP